MKKVLLIILVIIFAIAGYIWYKFSHASAGTSGPKQQALTLKKHSEKFNQCVSTAMSAYFDMSAAFVDSDTTKAKLADTKFVQLLDSIPMDELKKDTANIYETAISNLNDIKANATDMLTQTNLKVMRKNFSDVSDNLYPFFKIINYEGDNMYWQNCPMAFGDDQGANWVSKTVEVVNPYLGKNHPEFKATMLHCGTIKDTIKAK